MSLQPNGSPGSGRSDAQCALAAALPAASRVRSPSSRERVHASGSQTCTHPARCAEYRLIGKKGEGTFSEVLKAQAIKNGKYMAIKCMKNHFDSLDQARNPGPAHTTPRRLQFAKCQE